MDKDDIIMQLEEWFYRVKNIKDKTTFFLYIIIAIIVGYWMLSNLVK